MNNCNQTDAGVLRTPSTANKFSLSWSDIVVISNSS